jgi:hypothetical protein
MKKVPIEVHRTSGNQAHFVIPAHLDAMEVRGIIESVMEQLMLEDLSKASKHDHDCHGCSTVAKSVANDWQYKHDGD